MTEDTKLIKGILIIAIIILAIFCYVTRKSSPFFKAPEINSFSSTELSGATFEDLLDAIEWVESRGDANAVGDNGKAIGSFQIHKIYVDDINRINKLKHIDKYSSPLQWEYYHRENRPCSRIMVREYLGYYATNKRIGRKPTFEDMARIHNGGPDGWKSPSTEKYWLKVKDRMTAKYFTKSGEPK